MLLLIGVGFLQRIPLGRLAYARPRAAQAHSPVMSCFAKRL